VTKKLMRNPKTWLMSRFYIKISPETYSLSPWAIYHLFLKADPKLKELSHIKRYPP
jgi:hypothetical protein